MFSQWRHSEGGRTEVNLYSLIKTGRGYLRAYESKRDGIVFVVLFGGWDGLDYLQNTETPARMLTFIANHKHTSMIVLVVKLYLNTRIK
jgi:hypothetical protein